MIHLKSIGSRVGTKNLVCNAPLGYSPSKSTKEVFNVQGVWPSQNLLRDLPGNLLRDLLGNLLRDLLGNLLRDLLGNLLRDLPGNLLTDLLGNLVTY